MFDMTARISTDMVSRLLKTLMMISAILALSSFINLSSSYLSYSLLILFSIFSLIYILFLGRDEKSKIPIIDSLFILIILMCWVYGVTRALFLENDEYMILRNFFGMVCYGLIFFFALFKKSEIIKIIILSMVLNAILALGYYSYYTIERGMTGFFRGYYSVGLFMFMPCLAFTLSKVLNNLASSSEELIKYALLILVCVLFFVVIPLSKGNLLVAFILFFSVVTISLIRGLNHGYSFRFAASLILFLLTAVLLMLKFNLVDHLLFIFSSSESSNSTRSEQAFWLMQEFSYLGKGLGAGLESGYTRDTTYFYAFETSYHNVLHKLGIVALPLFFVYGFYLLKSIISCIKTPSIYHYFALGCMMFLLPSYGNPMLFNSISVVLHIFAILLLIPTDKRPS